MTSPLASRGGRDLGISASTVHHHRLGCLAGTIAAHHPAKPREPYSIELDTIVPSVRTVDVALRKGIPMPACRARHMMRRSIDVTPKTGWPLNTNAVETRSSHRSVPLSRKGRPYIRYSYLDQPFRGPRERQPSPRQETLIMRLCSIFG
jgi:hypothetical protein